MRVSAKTGEGLDALKTAIANELRVKSSEFRVASSESTRNSKLQTYADVTARQMSLLERARGAISGVGVGEPVLAANALRRAAEAIGEIVGKTYSADLLDAIFSRFCVGK